MQTPNKTSRKIKIPTTADTLRSKQHSQYIPSTHQNQRLYTEDVQTNLLTVKNRLNFDGIQKIQFSRIINRSNVFRPRTGKVEQNTYRNKMKTQLDLKFAEFMHREKRVKVFDEGKQVHNRVDEVLEKINKHIGILFKQFFWQIQQHKIKELNQFYLGLILKNMHFINNILYDRKIILSLYNDFKTPSILHLFIFILYLTAINTNNQCHESSIKQLVHDLFYTQGLKFHELHLKQGFEEIKLIANKRQYQMMRVNRRNRPTFVSLSHQKCKKHL